MKKLANISMFERLASRPITNAAIFNDTFDDVVAGGSEVAPVQPEVITQKEVAEESLVDVLEKKKPKYQWATVDKACYDAYKAVRALEVYVKSLRLPDSELSDKERLAKPEWAVVADSKIESLAKRIGMISGVARRAWDQVKKLRDEKKEKEVTVISDPDEGAEFVATEFLPVALTDPIEVSHF